MDGNRGALFTREEKPGGHRQKKYGDMYVRVVATLTRQLNGIVRDSVYHWFWDKITVEEYWLSSRKRKNAVMGMSRSATNICTLPSIKRTFSSVEKRWFRSYVTDMLASMNDRYVEQVLEGGHIDLLWEPTEAYETYKDLEQGWLVAGWSERAKSVEVY